ncbi:C39 family peptidase [Paenibacillus athensensis]|uniref:C39 family peptidase n=1 Tax=Paenibacillus athensensis TaxID=1967502 RepID=UPI001430CC31|nr:C39 family peptidase [Paenibacillus athensensis]MCD1261371.1 C39 family peptidase [Paenibacillus athensensis]
MNVKKMWLTLVAMILIAAVSPVSAFSAAPAGNVLSKSQFKELQHNALLAAEKYVNVVSQNGFEAWQSASITYQFPLFDFEDEITSFLFDITNAAGAAGYVVVSAEDSPVVIESAREGVSPYVSIQKNEKALYVGPTQYFIKKRDDTYYDIREHASKNKTNLKSNGSLNGSKKAPETGLDGAEVGLLSAPTVGINSVVSYSSKIISTVPDFSWRKGCSPTSFSNIIWYYRYSQGYTNLLQSTTTSDTLIDVLASSTYMNTNSSGATGWDDRVNGMKKFWSDRGYTVSVTRNSASFTDHKTEINANRPDIINVVGDATYSNHDMTGVGFEEYQESTENFKWYRYVIVHDTWNSTPKDVYIYLPQLSWNETVKVKP